MSTPSDAGYNRCRPVPPWNGSLSASRRRPATTRCSRGYRRDARSASRFPLPASLLRTAITGVGAILLVPALLYSQQPPPPPPTTPITAKAPAPTATATTHPEVVNLTLKGVKAVKQSDLLPSIYTTASHCNSALLAPICWISKSKNFYTRKYLDHQELQRDVLRVRIFYWKRGYRHTEVDTAVVSRGRNQAGVTFFIKEGPPTLISDIIINQPLPLLSQRELDKRVVITRNAPLNLIRIDTTRVLLQTRMFDKGYADAEVDTAIVVDTASNAASVTFTLNPKYKTTVEDIVINGNDDVSSRTIL